MHIFQKIITHCVLANYVKMFHTETMNLNTFLLSMQKILQKNHLRMTRPRLAVIKVLEQNRHRFLSSEEIFLQIQQYGAHNCDQTSVYRILNAFKQLNIVSKTDFHGEASRFRLNPEVPQSSPPAHQHFFRCLRCENISPLKDCLVTRQIRQMESEGYKDIGHHLELNGTCPSCAIG